MFFDLFYALCKERGISCKRAVEEIGLSNSIATKWKKTGATPTGETLDKIADYFNVSTDYLLGKENLLNPPKQRSLRSISRLESTPISDDMDEDILKYIDYIIEKNGKGTK